jgi:hypothetical protein
MANSSFKQIIRFFLKFLLIVSLILVCDRGIGTIIKFFYFRQESGVSYRTTYAIDSTFADILIFGSSRANHSYVPEIFEDGLHFTFYNSGRDGNFILYNYAIFKAITNRYNPKMIIIDISPDDLKYYTFEYERLSLLLPYYQANPEISRVVDFRGPFEKIKFISAIYPYNSLILQIAIGNLEYNKKRVPDNKGFVPLFKIMKHEIIDTSYIATSIIDENKIRALKDIISTCKQKNIDLIFVYSPIWSIIQDSYYNAIISNLCYENGIVYMDMSNDSIFINNPDYFSTIDHLNNEGAKVFSNMLIDKICRTKEKSSGLDHI